MVLPAIQLDRKRASLDQALVLLRQTLEQGDKIKISMQFRGREMAYKDAGMEKFKTIVEQIVEMGAAVEAEPKLMGNRIIAILASTKKPVKK